ncbi:hypothetical protein A2334_03255 [Candidatus Roizmanbacteria bacterium RIFOXYB2_FULL_38_10]|uniref:Glycosyltransferase 2-like domain-containing protein n=1 Tax=Candidatus Roizmanbacteria bacterium RIFOXYD1_FULL_38_12 TaxID=1802093 RepID=A0A1F7L172_9BACT|nr:MAG: hypothetical protein A3K47_03595 [Candidatus Roizmanbacteria bacterium RIFOXYA2_FULL_38_14]OGK63846.1 MAG: hypothetical protein A3K27_03595 [Candidatus Roizmanbacteria bacterium RIFOXYA1_FULL_37_12]OGK65692.1 MAG: hypothetical protein A3K38_03595 [Candidatus Roizmanbacteria bacterium RIFOXYB1_FULL_40_23]OGK67421.1 MAG: hypothetical protein A2334_03255 [Candidatus Roizmanbacteria bacterium RIFOXYB2_FULL_38_10]OGK70097.1 MAG: hypothetical protein A3K21_03600 [Candidatus Roizmanbacteria ba
MNFDPKTQRLLARKKIAIFIVMYNAEHFIENVLKRIPVLLRNKFTEIFIVDDSSTDRSIKKALIASKNLGYKHIRILKTPYNRGYGGNQKLGYLYAIKRKFDYVILLHGDGQYAPESLPDIINALNDISIDAVFGSRMINKWDALKGKMPVYKWIGNIILTYIENALLHAHLSEFHSGYRAYKVAALSSIPFEKNSDGFHFDTEIIIQLLGMGKQIREIKIPTYYGMEICHVNGISYAFQCLKSVIKYNISRFGIFYEPKFDIANGSTANSYLLKRSPFSIHQYIIKTLDNRTKTVIDLGANEGRLSAILAKKIKKVISVDIKKPTQSGKAKALMVDLESAFDKKLGRGVYDIALALDVIEHLKNPEMTAARIFNILKPSGVLYASTGNIAYAPIRLSLLLGMFNYGKRGILDLTHIRLFTTDSFRRLFEQHGFRVKNIRYFGPPIFDLSNKNIVFKLLDFILYHAAQVWPSLFAYQFLIEAQRLDSVDEIYEKTFR